MHTPHPPKNPAQLGAWIKGQLQLRGTNLAKLAEEHGLSRNAVARALHRPYPRAERIIGTALGVAPSDLWPDRYDEHGLPIRSAVHASGDTRSSVPPAREPRKGARG